MKIQLKYRDDYGEDRYSYRRYDFVRSSSQNWGFTCIDVLPKISEEFQIQASFVEIYSIEIERMEGFDEDVFVDNLWIGKNYLAGEQNILDEVSKVTKSLYSKWFEPRSVSSSYVVIVRVRVVLKRTLFRQPERKSSSESRV